CVAHAGNPCTGGGECADVCDEDHDKCARPAGSACSSDGNGCTDDVCDGDGQCTHPDNTAPCNDGKFCTVNDHCGGGECHGTPRDCTASADACRTGVCDEEAGQCTGPAKPNNTPCDDGDKCTLTDVCLNARCIGGAPVTCPAPDECHDAATCDPLDGTCSGPRKAPGTPCAGGALTCNAAGECARPASCGNGVFEPENGELCDGEDCCTADCTFKGATEVCGVETRVCHEQRLCTGHDAACPPAERFAAEGSPCDSGDECTPAFCGQGNCTRQRAVCAATFDNLDADTAGIARAAARSVLTVTCTADDPASSCDARLDLASSAGVAPQVAGTRQAAKCAQVVPMGANVARSFGPDTGAKRPWHRLKGGTGFYKHIKLRLNARGRRLLKCGSLDVRPEVTVHRQGKDLHPNLVVKLIHLLRAR